MFHLKELKNKFKFSARHYNRIVAWLNNVAEGWGLKITRPDDPAPGSPVIFAVDFEKLSAVFRLRNEPVETPQNPTDHSDIGAVSVLDGNDPHPWSWTADGTSGLMFDAYCLVTKPSSSSSYHDLRRVRLTYNAQGALAKAEMQPDGIRIRA